MIGKKFVIKVSEEGRDARFANLSEYTFHSDNASLKVNIAANPKHSDIIPFTFVSEPGPGEHVMFKIPHGYDFTPMISAFIGDPSVGFFDRQISYFRSPFQRVIDPSQNTISSYIVGADRHNIYFIVVREGLAWNLVKGTTIYIKYNIFDVKGLE